MMDGPTMRYIRDRMESLLMELCDEHKVDLVMGDMVNDFNTVKGKFELVPRFDPDPDETELERRTFASLCKNYGLQPGHYGAEFVANDELLKLVAIKPKNRVYPFVCQRANNQRVRVRPQQVCVGLGLMETTDNRHFFLTMPPRRRRSYPLEEL